MTTNQKVMKCVIDNHLSMIKEKNNYNFKLRVAQSEDTFTLLKDNYRLDRYEETLFTGTLNEMYNFTKQLKDL
jgi:hypothetical protein